MIRKLAGLAIVLLFFGLITLLLRGPQVSDALKKVVLTELRDITQREVDAGKISVNLFPLFVEARDVGVAGRDGEKILTIPRAKAYIELSGLISRQLTVRRLVIKEPELNSSRKEIEEVVDNVREYLAGGSTGGLKVKIYALEIQKGGLTFSDTDIHASASVKGLHGEIVFGRVPKIRASAETVRVEKEEWPLLEGSADVIVHLQEGFADIKRIELGVAGSRMRSSGEYQDGGLRLKTEITLLAASMKELFGLDSSGEGSVRASGTVEYGRKEAALDLDVKGNFYIQTLMELLKVSERVEGRVDVKGRIRGPLNNLRGSGTLHLKEGNLFHVDVDSLKCAVSYDGAMLRFTEGEGRLYRGEARVSASLALPVVNYFELNVDFKEVDSKPVFQLIGWDPGVQPGKVKGSLSSSGSVFNPVGSFEFRSVKAGRDILGRVGTIAGSFRKDGPIVTLTDLKIGTGKTDFAVNGFADLEKEQLSFAGELRSGTITDLTAPYYENLGGRVVFRGKVTGSFDDPVISGTIRIDDPVYKNYRSVLLSAEVVYRRELLRIDAMSIEGNGEKYRVSGNIFFRHAASLFELERPEFDITASVDSADLEKFVRIFYQDFRGKGKLNAKAKIGGTGSAPLMRGDAFIVDGEIYSVSFDNTSFGWSYLEKTLSLERMTLVRGRSVISADSVSLTPEGRFSYKAHSERILLSDIVRRELRGDAVFSLKSEGSGTFENPSLVVRGRMVEGSLKNKPVGSGELEVAIRNKDIHMKAALLDDKVRISGKGRLEGEFPWEAAIHIESGRYDSVISAFLKDAPEDLILNLDGAVNLRGDRNNLSASGMLDRLTLSMYGYSFTNDKGIKVDLRNRQLFLDNITMRSGNTALNIDGSMVIGSQYNVVVEGNSSLSPFKSLSDKIAVLKGDAEFVVSVTGNWENPQINGGVTLTNGSFGLKEYSQRISALHGYLYMDNDKIVLQKLAGKLSGGDIDLSGIVYMKKFRMKRFYVETKVKNVTGAVSGDFTVNFGGNLLYRGTPASQTISGDISINRARYRERIDWKSWLLKSKKAERFKAEISPLEKTELNIRITGKDNIRIDNNVARALLNVDVLLRGTLYRPLLFGRLETKEGTVYFRNNEFRILHASADFSDPNRINPFIEVASETIVKGYKIRMNLEGELDHFTMSLVSDPTLKEIDILALLTVGQTGGELKGLEGGIGASEATSFVTGKLQDVLEERLSSITGLDRFQIDPHVSKTTGTIEPRITVSKRLLGDKFFVTYTSTVGSTEEQIIKLEYFLSKSTSLVGIRDERGLVGGDVRFRFEFK